MGKLKSITSARIAYNYAKDVFKDLDHEELWVLYMDSNQTPISFERMTSGGWSSTVIDLRQIFSVGLKHQATRIILFHNHISSSCKPSFLDIDRTNDARKICSIMEMMLVDHIIISKSGYYSFSEERVRKK